MKRTLLLFIALVLFTATKAQTPKPLTIDDLTKWNRITERAISDDGSLVGFVIEPWDGDPAVRLYDSDAAEKASFTCATGVTVTADSRFVIFTIKPSKAGNTYSLCYWNKNGDAYVVAKRGTQGIPAGWMHSFMLLNNISHTRSMLPYRIVLLKQ